MFDDSSARYNICLYVGVTLLTCGTLDCSEGLVSALRLPSDLAYSQVKGFYRALREVSVKCWNPKCIWILSWRFTLHNAAFNADQALAASALFDDDRVLVQVSMIAVENSQR